jgi:N-methylhydantoinase B/oxoprolinase/acetone carboxylase alpha subunit
VAQLSTNLDRFKFPPFGLDGGMPAALSRLTLTRDGKVQELPSKVTNLMVRKGDIVRLETSGGGGFGAPETRDRELVERDVRLGYVGAEAAASVYRLDAGRS